MWREISTGARDSNGPDGHKSESLSCHSCPLNAGIALNRGCRQAVLAFGLQADIGYGCKQE